MVHHLRTSRLITSARRKVVEQVARHHHRGGNSSQPASQPAARDDTRRNDVVSAPRITRASILPPPAPAAAAAWIHALVYRSGTQQLAQQLITSDALLYAIMNARAAGSAAVARMPLKAIPSIRFHLQLHTSCTAICNVMYRLQTRRTNSSNHPPLSSIHRV